MPAIERFTDLDTLYDAFSCRNGKKIRILIEKSRKECKLPKTIFERAEKNAFVIFVHIFTEKNSIKLKSKENKQKLFCSFCHSNITQKL